MGLGSWLKEQRENAALAQFISSDAYLRVYSDRFEAVPKMKGEKAVVPWSSVTRVAIEDGADLQSRVTATRLLALGVFAFAAKKKSGGEKFLVVETEDSYLSFEVDRKKVAQARQFMAKAESARRAAGA